MFATIHRIGIQTLRCRNCDRAIDVKISNFELPIVLLIEFSPEIVRLCSFKTQINIDGTVYVLKGLVRHTGNHFTCALSGLNSWSYIDDLRPNKKVFSSLNSLYNQFSCWFFAVYCK